MQFGTARGREAEEARGGFGKRGGRKAYMLAQTHLLLVDGCS